MTQREEDIWTSYLNKVEEFLNATDLSKLVDEDKFQEAFCDYMNAHYHETKREVRVPTLKQIDGLGKEHWEIDESTKYDKNEYIPCELKFHGTKLEEREYVDEVHIDAEEMVEIVKQFKDVNVGVCIFVTTEEDEALACEDLGDVLRKSFGEGKNRFYVIVARFMKSELGERLRRFAIENLYQYYYDK